MTPEELRALADEWDTYPVMLKIAPALARLCAAMGTELAVLEWVWSIHLSRHECPSCGAIKEAGGKHKADCELREILDGLAALASNQESKGE